MTKSAGGPSRPAAASSARTKLAVCTLLGALGAGIGVAMGAGRAAPLIGWDTGAAIYCWWVWATVWRMDPAETAKHAVRENPNRDLTDLVLLGAAIASLVAVGAVLFGASSAPGTLKYIRAGFALSSIFVSWTVIHTVYALQYALLYYSGTPGDIDFNEAEPPQYSDFAYLAFTIGMTFQVSDTDIKSKVIRRTALKHAWLSFPLGAVIIAAAINLVSGLAK